MSEFLTISLGLRVGWGKGLGVLEVGASHLPDPRCVIETISQSACWSVLATALKPAEQKYVCRVEGNAGKHTTPLLHETVVLGFLPT